jgi:hypothetical protein
MKKQSSISLVILLMLMAGLSFCTKENEGGVTNNPSVKPGSTGDYSVFAWNDLGMHCLNPSYDKLVILPPYNNVLVQVVKRGNPPTIVTSGITVSYKLTNNTTSYNKRSYGGFWDNFAKLFGPGIPPAHDIGLKGNGLSGDMALSGDHYVAEGIPVVPVNDNGTWNPFQVAEITVKNSSGTVLIQTQAMVPTSDEINCAKCHGSATINAFDDILAKHDLKHSTSLSLAASKPVLCASCHPSPALGITTGPQKYLSQVLHGSHAGKTGIGCYDCHPGATTKCNRSLAHTAADGNCTTCHGDMANVASTIASGRVPWASEPSCATCHTGVTGVSTGTTLYRNARGHGDIYCTACHGSPHAMYPSRETADNYQPNQYQGSKIKTIGSCGICHSSSRGQSGSSGEFTSEHGGTNPDKSIGCRVCHTSVPSNTANWPHAYTWKNSN